MLVSKTGMLRSRSRKERKREKKGSATSKKDEVGKKGESVGDDSGLPGGFHRPVVLGLFSFFHLRSLCFHRIFTRRSTLRLAVVSYFGLFPSLAGCCLNVSQVLVSPVSSSLSLSL